MISLAPLPNEECMIRKLLCLLGFHSGICNDGAYRCNHCDFTDPYHAKKLQEEGLTVPTESEDCVLQGAALSWRSTMPPQTRDFEGIGELNYSSYVDNGVFTGIFWRNENFQCKIHFIKRIP